MRKSRIFGWSDTELACPIREDFACRALQLGNELKLCLYCLHSNARCADSDRHWPKNRNWKSHRARQRKSPH